MTTQLTRTTRKRSDLHAELEALREIGRALSAAHDVQATLQAISQTTANVMRMDSCSIYLLDNSLMATDLQRAIGSAVRHAVEPRHRLAFVERLEGWWFHRVVLHLIDTSNRPIPVQAIQQQVHELRGQFQRESLPDDLFNAPVPTVATPSTDARVFVLQLVLIGLSAARLRIAQEDDVAGAGADGDCISERHLPCLIDE